MRKEMEDYLNDLNTAAFFHIPMNSPEFIADKESKLIYLGGTTAGLHTALTLLSLCTENSSEDLASSFSITSFTSTLDLLKQIITSYTPIEINKILTFHLASKAQKEGTLDESFTETMLKKQEELNSIIKNTTVVEPLEE